MEGSVAKLKQDTKDKDPLDPKNVQKSRIERICDSDDLSEIDFTEQREMGEYSKVSAEFDPITRATPRVKFFFSILEDTKPIIIQKPDGTQMMSSTLKLNAAGLPQCVDFKEAWGKILNRVYDCRSQRDLYIRLEQLAKNNKQYVPIFNKYKRLLKEAYETGPDGSVFNDDWSLRPVRHRGSDGLVLEITATINHAKNIPSVAQSM